MRIAGLNSKRKPLSRARGPRIRRATQPKDRCAAPPQHGLVAILLSRREGMGELIS